MARLVMSILWPAFLAACALELVVFAFIDPAELGWSDSRASLSRQGIYTGAFFVFWAIAAASCALSASLQRYGKFEACPPPPPPPLP